MKKLIFFDFDGTLTESSSWYLFNTYFGMTKEEDSSLFERYLKNGFNYREWMEQIIHILKDRGLCTEEKVREFSETIQTREGARDLIQACKDAGYMTVVISGGIKQVVEPITQNLGADKTYTTAEIIFNQTGLLENIIDQSDERHAKLKAFEEICLEFGVDPEDTLAVGDGGNDLEIFKRTKKGIQIGDYEPLKEFAWKRVENLSEIKELL